MLLKYGPILAQGTSLRVTLLLGKHRELDQRQVCVVPATSRHQHGGHEAQRAPWDSERRGKSVFPKREKTESSGRTSSYLCKMKSCEEMPAPQPQRPSRPARGLLPRPDIVTSRSGFRAQPAPGTVCRGGGVNRSKERLSLAHTSHSQLSTRERSVLFAVYRKNNSKKLISRRDS